MTIGVTTKSALPPSARKEPEPEYLSTAQAAPESLMKRLEAMMAVAHTIGTQQAALAFRGQLTHAEREACDWFAQKRVNYERAIEAKGVQSGSAELVSKTEPPDPDSRAGEEMTRRSRNAVNEYLSAELSGLACGRDRFRLFYQTIVEQIKPGGLAIAATKRVAEAVRDHRQKSSRFRRGRRA